MNVYFISCTCNMADLSIYPLLSVSFIWASLKIESFLRTMAMIIGPITQISSRYTGCVANSCASQRSLPNHTTILGIFGLTLQPYPLNHLMIKREKPHLDRSAQIIRDESEYYRKKRDDPKRHGWGEALDEQFVSISRIIEHGSIYEEE